MDSPTTTTVEGLVAMMTHWAIEHNIPAPASPAQTFADAGFDSLHSIELAFFLEDKVGVSLDETVLYNYPTFEALARYLLERSGVSVAHAFAGKAASAEPAGEAGDW